MCQRFSGLLLVWVFAVLGVLQGCAGTSPQSEDLFEEDEGWVEPLRIGNIEVRSKEGLWTPAQGLLPNRMADPSEQPNTIYRSIWKHPEGDRLVCLQYPGGELFGTPYDVSVFDRGWNVIRQGAFTVGQDDTPFCIVQVRTWDEEVPESLRGRWLLAGGFWNSGYTGQMVGNNPIGRLAQGKPPRVPDAEPFGFYLSFPIWDGQEEKQSARSRVGRRGSTIEVEWIEPGQDLMALAIPTPGRREDPKSFRLPRAVLEPKLVDWIESEDEHLVVTAMQLITAGGIRSPEASERVNKALKRLLAHTSPWVRREACVTMLALEGKGALPAFATMTEDPNGEVGIYATMALVLAKDPRYIDAIIKGCAAYSQWENEEDIFVSRDDKTLVWVLEQWDDPASIPALMQFLDDVYRPGQRWDGWRYQHVADRKTYQGWGNAALQAQRVLRELTGAGFPFDTDAAMQAWNQVRDLPVEQRNAALKAKFPTGYQRAQLTLTAENTEAGIVLAFHNASDVEAWVMRTPSRIAIRGERSGGSGPGSYYFEDGKAPKGMINVPPQGKASITIPASDRFEMPVEIGLEYWDSDPDKRVITWQGTLKANVPRTVPDEPAADSIRGMFESDG